MQESDKILEELLKGESKESLMLNLGLTKEEAEEALDWFNDKESATI